MTTCFHSNNASLSWFISYCLLYFCIFVFFSSFSCW